MSCTGKTVAVLGIAGGIIGIHVYNFMSPKGQRDLRRGMRKTVDSIKDIT